MVQLNDIDVFGGDLNTVPLSARKRDKFKDYETDTPCTYAVQFTIVHGRLDMCVTMRSNDLWYGFCNGFGMSLA